MIVLYHLDLGQDPDDIIQSQGAEKMKEIINNAVPMIDLLWQRELEVQTLDSPDRKAAFDASLKRITKRILEPSIRDHYFAAFKSKRAQLLKTSDLRTIRNRKGTSINAFATLGTKTSALASDSSNTRSIMIDLVFDESEASADVFVPNVANALIEVPFLLRIVLRSLVFNNCARLDLNAAK